LPPANHNLTASAAKAGVTGKRARFGWVMLQGCEGPQHVTVHGRDEVVIIASEEFRRLKGVRTGQALIEALQASPHRDIDIEPQRVPMPVRDVSL
jgi:hypothetical protein